MIRRPPRSTLSSSSAASDVYKRQDDNMAPPGAMIGFELLQAADDQTWYVKLYLTTQSMNQMRFASPLNSTHPPARAPLIIPECYGGPELSCAVQDFQKLADKVVRPECVRVLQC
eukprot:TRINITY_DN5764_c0_g1_i3.p1 TRINITY_DN5764_c0_g1~~TRINITY_DN5764_c0_g1_i3.p1  ORF type:complete len:115 (-),score=27.89 TRINITY_DN5764_c0_g1_i3:248-592(-)